MLCEQLGFVAKRVLANGVTEFTDLRDSLMAPLTSAELRYHLSNNCKPNPPVVVGGGEGAGLDKANLVSGVSNKAKSPGEPFMQR